MLDTYIVILTYPYTIDIQYREKKQNTINLQPSLKKTWLFTNYCKTFSNITANEFINFITRMLYKDM